MDVPSTPAAIELEIVRASLDGIVQEMQGSLFRTGYSTIIRESQDASCAIMDTNGEVISQHVVLPLHIGSFPACCQAILSAYSDIEEGDAFIINHPYEGGSPHAPDLCVLTPVFVGGTLFAFCGSIAHKSDIGGPVPGSCSGQAREIFNEGLQLPALRCERAFRPVAEIERIIAANSRTPELVIGDMRGQLGAGRLGDLRLRDLAHKYGSDPLASCFGRLLESARARMTAAISDWNDGTYSAERFVDDDGIRIGSPVRIHVAVEKCGERIRFDFSASDDQTLGPANIRPPLARAAVAYCLVALVDPHLAINSGIFQAFDLTLREGSVMNPRYPAPVNTYNPTVHAVVEAVFAALAEIVPSKARADGCGSRSIILGGRNTSSGKNYVQYEILGGGAGARATKDGASGTTVNQSNAKIAPIEIIESEFPTRLIRFELIPDSGGIGTFRGGLGVRRQYANLEPARFSIRSTKHVIAPQPVAGGGNGRTGDIVVNPGNAEERRLPTRDADYPLERGDTFVLDTPGGGGFGNALSRDPTLVARDVEEGYVTSNSAYRDYGVVLLEDNHKLSVDHDRTSVRRRQLRDQMKGEVMPATKTGVIGLGAMGFQMARHMLKKGFDVHGIDVSDDMNERARHAGVKIVSEPAELGASEVVIVMVATDKQVEDVVLHSGLLDTLEGGSIVCIASSCSMELAREIESECKTRNIGALDTPVVLGQEAADNGTLTVFCGGEEAAFLKASPVLRSFGAHVMHVGPSGMGQLTKTINNMLLWACMSANFECLSLARQVGADIPRMISALQHSSGANWSLSRWGKSTGKWAEKDMDVALDLAQVTKVPVPLAALVDQLMKGMNRDKMQGLMS